MISADEGQNHKRLVNYLDQQQLAAKLNLDKKSSAGDWQALFEWIKTYLDYAINTKHKHFNNRMWSAANLPSVLGEIIVAIKNTSACSYESAPIAVFMEQYMIDQMLQLVGFNSGDGQMTTGSSNANMIAMMAARNQFSNVSSKGLFVQKPLFAFVSKDAHYSFDKAANILGIGSEQLIKVPTDECGQMDNLRLEALINKVISHGGQPFFIGATLGTTVRGAYDDIAELLSIKNKYKLWLHGDGAWGGAAIMSNKLKAKFLLQLDQLDSFTMDFHKMLGTALICNFLLFRQKNLLCQTCSSGDTSYVFHNPLDLGIKSLQCGRRVDSLKWFLDWKFFTRVGFAKRVEHYYKLAQYAEHKISTHHNLTLVAKRISFNVCFHYKTTNSKINAFNLAIRDELVKQSKDLIAMAYIDEVFVFRLLLTHPYMDTDTIDEILTNITSTGEKLLTRQL